MIPLDSIRDDIRAVLVERQLQDYEANDIVCGMCQFTLELRRLEIKQ